MTNIDTQTQTQTQPHSVEETIQENAKPLVLKPLANLYRSDEGWLIIAALPGVRRNEVKVETEGAKLILDAPREQEEQREVFQRTFCFPKGTKWGEIKAKWEGELLHIELKRATPERRSVTIAS